MALKLTKSERKLVEALTQGTDHRGGYSLNEIITKLDTTVAPARMQQRVSALKETLSDQGVKLWENKDRYWIDYQDLSEFTISSDSPNIFLYLSPAAGGIGTSLFDPEIAKGLSLYLKSNRPSFQGKELSENTVAESLDGIIMLGGMPAVPLERSAKSKEADFLGGLLEQLPHHLRNDARIHEEMDKIRKMRNARVSDEIIRKYEASLAFKIRDMNDASAYVKDVLTTMFSGINAPIYYHPAEEDKQNKEYLKKLFENNINKGRAEYKDLEKRMNSSHARMDSAKVKKAMLLHVMEEIINAEEHIFDDRQRLVSVYHSFGGTGSYTTIKKAMKEDPRGQIERNTFDFLLKEYIFQNTDRLMDGQIQWRNQYLTDLTDEQKTDLMDNGPSIGAKIISDLGRCRTYLGLGWRITIPKSSATEKDSVIFDEIRKQRKITPMLADAQMLLYSLGWLEDKDIASSNIIDRGILNLFLEDSQQAFYNAVADGLDFRVLNSGVSDFLINGSKLRAEYSPTDSNPGKDDLTKKVDQLYEDSKIGAYVPNVWLMGPSSGASGVFFFRTNPENISQGPNLKYEDQPNVTAVFQLGNTYTTEAVKKFRRDNTKSPTAFPGQDTTKGEIFIDVIIPNGIHDITLLDVDDLKKLANPKKAKFIEHKELMVMDDVHSLEQSHYLHTSAGMHLKAIMEYVKNEISVPDLLKLSEGIDGSQRFGPTDLTHVNNGPSLKQLYAAQDILKKTKIPQNHKDKLWAELSNMIAEGRHEPNLDIQAEHLISSAIGDLTEAVAEKGGHIIYVGGDHAQRSTGTLGSEAVKFRNGFLRVYTKKNGVSVAEQSVAEQIHIGKNYESKSGELFFNNDGAIEGLDPIYASHKLERDVAKHARQAGLSDIVLTAHRHHPHVIKDGGRRIIVSSGLATTNPYVREAGMHANLKGLWRISLPSNTSPYSDSLNFTFIPENVLLKYSPEVKERIALRQELVSKYIPSNPR